MTNTIHSVLNAGSESWIIDIECIITQGLPGMIIVGLGNKAIDEAKERIRNAFHSSKLAFPKKRITINMAPADIPKHSTSFDIAIAAALILKQQDIKPKGLGTVAFIGELGLDGSVRTVRGIIGKIINGKKHGLTTFCIPKSNLNQAALVPDAKLIPIESLQDVADFLNDKLTPTTTAVSTKALPTKYPYRLDDVSGQDQAKRGLEIAAAGGHNILLNGPPGTGKSMLAKVLPSLLPAMSIEQILETTHLYSLAGAQFDQIISERPFRSPHHTASRSAVVGGGREIQPGEISLSHNGVLLLDEMPEYARNTLESLRQPLEDGIVTIARAEESVTFPARFILVATANPCPCGYYGTQRDCICTPARILQYRQRISGPIMDRIDLHITVDSVNHASLLQVAHTNQQQACQQNVSRARQAQEKRFHSPSKLNTTMSNREIMQYCNLSISGKSMLDQAADRLRISARSYIRVVKVAQTIADLEGANQIDIPHISEALQYRPQNYSAILQE